MKTTYRPYQTEEDYWRMREFLRQVYLLNNYLEHSWHVVRLDYCRYHTLMNCAHLRLEDVVTIWEVDGQMIGFILPDGGKGEAHLSIHPEMRTEQLEREMIDVAEACLAETTPAGTHKLRVWATGGDELRQNILVQRGYVKDDWIEHNWRRRLDQGEVVVSPPAPGFTVRSLGDGVELLERCYASGLGFHQGDIQIAVDNRKDATWYRNIQTAPLYRRDLDLVAVTPDGAIAAFTTIWFDDVTRSAVFEPVATVPDYQRRGLGKAVMTEGLRRLQRRGCLWALVAGSSPWANALYSSVIGPDYELYESWIREW